MEASKYAYKRNIILNGVRQHNYFITQGNYVGNMFRLQISHLQAYFCHLSHKMLCTFWDPDEIALVGHKKKQICLQTIHSTVLETVGINPTQMKLKTELFLFLDRPFLSDRFVEIYGNIWTATDMGSRSVHSIL